MNTNREIKAAYKHTKAGTFLFNLCAKWTMFLVEHRWLYYLLACTWGIIMTIIGFIVSGVLAIAKLFLKDKIVFKPYHWIYSISAGPDRWGGSEFGLCFLRDHKSGSPLAEHEFGHSFHNCLFGPLFPFVVAIPSAIWYWSRKLKTANASKPYDTTWFEDAATQCGLYANRVINVRALDDIEVSK